MKKAIYLLLLISNISIASQTFDCKKAEPDAVEIYQQLEGSTIGACIFLSGGERNAVISFYNLENQDYRRISYNNKLISSNEEMPILEEAGGDKFNLMYYYPRDIYIINLEVRDAVAYVRNIYKTIRLPSATSEGEINEISFRVKNTRLGELSFTNLTSELAFESQYLEISPSSIGIEATITSDKSYLYKSASRDRKTKAYLIKGDVVKVLEINRDWVLIEYTNPKGISIARWISIVEIL